MTPSHTLRAGALVLATLGAGVTDAARAATLVLDAVHDTTLYSENGAASNGAGEFLFAGRTAVGATRRALLHFGPLGLPVNAVVETATVTLTASRSVLAGVGEFTLTPLTRAWGEAGSDAGGGVAGGGGGGAPAQPGDATWSHAEFDLVQWSSPGGDFAAAPSAASAVGGPGSYTWSSAQLAADVQAWLDGSADNFGWLLRGPEQGVATAKRFVSCEFSGEAGLRPRLELSYSVVPLPPAALLLAPTVLVALAAGAAPRSRTMRRSRTRQSHNA